MLLNTRHHESETGRRQPSTVRERKTVLVVLSERFSLRNFLLTPLFDLLSDSREMDVVFCIPGQDFPRSPGNREVRHECLLPPAKDTWLRRRLASTCAGLEHALFHRYQLIQGFRGFNLRVQGLKLSRDFDMYQDRDNRKEYRFHLLQRLLLGRSLLVYRLLKGLHGLLYGIGRPEVGDLFERISPDLMVTNEPHNHRLREYYAEASRRGVPTLSMVLSWDNVILRGIMVPTVKRFLVWNQVTRQELHDHHGVPKDAVQVVGLPHLDCAAEPLSQERRAEFLRSLGADPERRTLVYATSASRIGRDEHEICHHIADKIARNGYDRPCNLVIRLHHIEGPARYREFEDMPGVVVQRGVKLEYKDLLERGLVGDSRDMLTLLRAGDALLTIASTIALEAVFMDTPVINIGFDGTRTRPPYASAWFFLQNEHYAKFLDHQASRTALNFESLDAAINAYLADPDLDAQGRERARQSYLGAPPGEASLRVYQAIRQAAGVEP